VAGTITNHAQLVVNRSDDLTLAGAITGAGSLTKSGAGTLTLTASNTYSGGTTILAGALQIGNGSTTGTITGNIANEAALIVNRTGNLNYAGIISGTGTVTKLGAGTFTISGANTYTGGTTISAGVVQVGTGGTSGSIVGDVTNNGSISFARSDVVTFAGVISGTGSLENSSTGTLKLTGANTYTGGTTISAGLVQVGSGGTTGSIVGNVTNNGSISFARSDVVTFAGVISGTGSLENSSTGTLKLTGASTYTGGTSIANGTLQIGDGGTTGSIVGNVTSSGTHALTFNRSDDLTFAGVISGPLAVTQAGAGTLTLSGTNTYTSSTTVSAGTLQVTGALSGTSGITVASGATLGGTGSLFASNSTNTLTVSSGATLSPGVAGSNGGVGSLTVNGNLAMAAGSTLAVDIAGNTAGSGYDQLVVKGSVDVSGATLSAAHRYSAAYGDSYVLIDNDGSDAITGTLAGLAEGASLTANGTVLDASYVGGSDNNDIKLTPQVNAGPVIGNLSGDRVAWAGVGNYVTLDAGTAVTVSDPEFGALNGGNGNWNGATLTLNRVTSGGAADGTSKDLFNFLANSTFALGGDGSIAYAGYPEQSIEEAQAKGQNATGVLVNSATTGWFARWSYTYATGTLVIQFGDSASGNPDVNETPTTALVQAVLQSIAYRNDTPYGDTTLRVTLSDGAATGSADVTVTSSTIYADSTADTDSQGDAADGFSLREALTRSASQAGADTIRVVLADNSSYTLASGATVGGGDTLNLDGANGLTISGGTLTLGGALTVSNAAAKTATFNSEIAGSGQALTKDGAGTLSLSGSNSYTGATTVAAGTLTVGGGSAIADSSAVTVANGGTLNLSASESIGSLAGAGVVTLGNNTLTAGADNSSSTFSGAMSGSGGFTKTGSGTATLSGSNSYAGATTISTGTLVVSGGSAIGDSSAVMVASGATLALGSGAETLGSLAGAGSVTLASGATLTVGGDNTSTTFSGDISSAGSLSKAGTGTLTLSGTHTYTGATTVAGGTLSVTGALSGTSGVTVASGASLGGTGSIFAAHSSNMLTVQSGATLAPGVLGLNNGIGKLTVNGGLTLAAGGILAVDIKGGTTAGSDYDQVDVLGSVSVSGATITPTLSYSPSSGTIHTLINNDASDSVTGAFGGLAQGATLTSAGTPVALTASYIGGSNNNDFTLALVEATPPPSVSAITRVNTAASNASSVQYTVRFSESVSGVDLSDFSLSRAGTVSGNIASVTGSGDTYTVTVSGITGDGTLRLDLNSAGTGINGARNNAIEAGYTGGEVYTFDHSAPTAPSAPDLASGSDTGVSNADNITSITTPVFTGTAEANATVRLYDTDGMTLLGTATADASGHWSITSSTLSDGVHAITARATDAAGNVSAASAATSVSINATAPTLAAAITLSDTMLKLGDTATVTFSFSEAVSGFTLADVSVSNGVLSGLVSSDGGFTWTATLAPNADTTAASNALTLDHSGIADLAGNAGSGTSRSGNYTVDTVRPALASHITISDTALKLGDTATVTFSFSEAVSGFTLADVSVSNGVLSDLVSSDGGITWTATLAPNADTTAAGNALTLDHSGIADLAGNAGSGTSRSGNYAIDSLAPAVDISVSAASLALAGTATVTFSFSEDPGASFTWDGSAGDVVVVGGTLSAISGSGLTRSATFTPTPGVNDGRASITVAKGAYLDAAGNAGRSGAAPSISFDTARPTASIVVASGELLSGTTSLVTVSFSEAVTGLSNADLTVTGGSLSPLRSADGGRTWTATFTPTEGLITVGNTIALDSAAIADAAGNRGMGTVRSNSYAVNTLPLAPPRVEVAPPPAAAGGPASNSVAVMLAPHNPAAAVAGGLVAETAAASGQTLAGPASFAAPASATADGGGFSPGALSPIEPSLTRATPSAFPVSVLPADQAGLRIVKPLADQSLARAGVAFSFTIPTDAFAHSEATALIQLSAKLSNGQALPAWLKFDPASGTFTGQPPAELGEPLSISVTARDADGREVTTVFRLTPQGLAGELEPRSAPETEATKQPLQSKRQPVGRMGFSDQLRAAGRLTATVDRAPAMTLRG
jgi:autotransporter-associated beta strand protein